MATTTTNGGKCLSTAGAVKAQTDGGKRGGALTTLSQHLVGPRGHSNMFSKQAVQQATALRAGTLPPPVAQLRQFLVALAEENKALGAAAEQLNTADLMALVFDAGDTREGKGERQLFVWLLLELLHVVPKTVVACVPLIPEYASFRVLNVLYHWAGTMEAAAKAYTRPHLRAVQQAVVDVYVAALRADEKALDAAAAATTDGGGGHKTPRVSLSLAAKWAPRQASSRVNRPLFRALRAALFPESVGADVATDAVAAGKLTRGEAATARASRAYRRLVARLARQLDVVESKMAAGAWTDITPTHVPSLALRRMRRAFTNVTVKKTQRSEAPERVACAEAFAAAAAAVVANPTAKKRLKGAGNAPHELVGLCMKPAGAEDALTEAAWVDLVQSLREKNTLRSAVAVVDVSGSMTCAGGIPMRVAVAMGLLVSELTPEPFRGRLLTFTSTPTWHVLPEPSSCSLRERVQAVMRAPWGCSTNFEAAMEAVLHLCVSHRLPQSAVPEMMIVLSDMQFDVAKGGHPFAADRVQSRFAAAGYTAPHIVFWNLAVGGRPVFQAETSTPGVSFLSGFSQTALKDLCEEGPAALEDLVEVTPWDMLQVRLARDRLRAVREVCAAVGEGPLAGYVVPPPAPVAAEEDGEVDGEDAKARHSGTEVGAGAGAGGHHVAA